MEDGRVGAARISMGESELRMDLAIILEEHAMPPSMLEATYSIGGEKTEGMGFGDVDVR